MGRFINADALASTGQGLLGNNMFAYCNNNPVCYSDPTGYLSAAGGIGNPNAMMRGGNNSNVIIHHLPSPDLFEGTITIGASASQYAGTGGGVSGGITFDGKKNASFAGTVALGAGTPSDGYSIFVSYTTAPTIDKLSGRAEYVGGSIAILLVTIGFEYSIFNDSYTGDAYHGFTILIGPLSEIPFETHGGLSYTGVMAH